jgi:hypothetical protein
MKFSENGWVGPQWQLVNIPQNVEQMKTTDDSPSLVERANKPS